MAADNTLAVNCIGRFAGKLKFVGEVFGGKYIAFDACKKNMYLLGRIHRGLAAMNK